MSDRQKIEREQTGDQAPPEWRRRGDTTGTGGPSGTPGADTKGVVEGVGAAGGSSGAGAVRSLIDDAGDVSGIDTPARGTPPAYRERAVGRDQHKSPRDGGNRGKTRGPDSETIPNPSDDDNDGQG